MPSNSEIGKDHDLSYHANQRFYDDCIKHFGKIFKELDSKEYAKILRLCPIASRSNQKDGFKRISKKIFKFSDNLFAISYINQIGKCFDLYLVDLDTNISVSVHDPSIVKFSQSIELQKEMIMEYGFRKSYLNSLSDFIFSLYLKTLPEILRAPADIDRKKGVFLARNFSVRESRGTEDISHNKRLTRPLFRGRRRRTKVDVLPRLVEEDGMEAGSSSNSSNGVSEFDREGRSDRPNVAETRRTKSEIPKLPPLKTRNNGDSRSRSSGITTLELPPLATPKPLPSRGATASRFSRALSTRRNPSRDKKL